MSIESEITRINTNIANAYTAVSTKGGTLPETQNSANLATAINSITSGGDPRLICKYTIDADNVITTVEADLTDLFDDIEEIDDSGLQGAFAGTDAYGDVTFPNCTTVGKKALANSFENSAINSFAMPNLTTVNKKEAFYQAFDSSDISSVDLTGLTTINADSAFESAFVNCENLLAWPLPNVTSISGKDAFCEILGEESGVTQLDMPDLTTIGERTFHEAFVDNITLEGWTDDTFYNVTSIGRAAFEDCFNGCESLSAEFINNNNITLQERTFQGAFEGSGITNFSMPNATVTGGRTFMNAFAGCESLTNFEIGELSLNTMDTETLQSTFNGCSSLESVDLGTLSALNINGMHLFNRTFNGCSSLTTLNSDLFANVTSVGYSDQSNQLFNGTALTSLPNFTSLTFVQGSFFDDLCYGLPLTSCPTFPALTTVSGSSFNRTFYNCYTMGGEVSFPSIQSLEGFYQAFCNTAITKITFGPNLSSMDMYALNMAFSGCSNLTEIHFPASARVLVEQNMGYNIQWGAPNATVVFDPV